MHDECVNLIINYLSHIFLYLILLDLLSFETLKLITQSIIASCPLSPVSKACRVSTQCKTAPTQRPSLRLAAAPAPNLPLYLNSFQRLPMALLLSCSPHQSLPSSDCTSHTHIYNPLLIHPIGNVSCSSDGQEVLAIGAACPVTLHSHERLLGSWCVSTKGSVPTICQLLLHCWGMRGPVRSLTAPSTR